MPISSPTQTTSREAHPGGPIGLTLGTKVMTIDGELPVEFLTPGDRIITRTGVRRLEDVTVSVHRDLELVRFSASTLGFDRPCEETLLPMHQMILIRDWRAMALYGSPQALVAAGRMADGSLIRIETGAHVRIFTLAFDADVVIYAGGLELECQRLSVSA